MHLDPLIPLPAIALIGIVFLGLTIALYQRTRAIVSQRYWRLLLATKILSLVALLALLANPYFLFKTPDERTFRVAVLADASGSMQTQDCGDRNRLDVLKQDVISPEAPFHQRVLSRFANRQFYVFADSQPRRFTAGTDFDVAPGETDVDGALQHILTSADQIELGAVLLVSDGQDNVGKPMLDIAGAYKQAGIPIHIIGVGDRRERDDIGIAWKTVPKSAIKGKPVRLAAILRRNHDGDYTTTVDLIDDGRVVDQAEVTFSGDQREAQVSFEPTPFTAGFKTYQVRVPALNEQENKLNNVDFASFQVKDPDIFKILFFSANLDWNYKFLRHLADEQEKLVLDAIIRTGDENFFIHGIEQEKESIEGFPAEVVNEYECVIIHLNSLYLLSEEEVDGLVRFVNRRGGGVIFTGHTDDVPERILKMLPVKQLPSTISALPQAGLELKASQVFARLKPRSRKQLGDSLFVPAESAIYALDAEDVKPGAITVANLKTPPWVSLAVHNYGAGKVALLNLEDTWKWVMTVDRGDRYYGLFWGNLISWVASSSKQRLTIRPAPSKLLLHREQQFRVDVLDDEFAADNNASVRATITAPDGAKTEFTLFPSARVDGRYEGAFLPRLTGEYRFHFAVTPGSGDPIHRLQDYLVVDLSPESEPKPLAVGQLQSLSRLTSGQYWNYSEINSIDKLPLNQTLKYREERHNFIESWVWLLVLLGSIVPDWVLRRRIGLK